MAGFADDSNVGCERKKQVKDDSQVFWPKQLEGIAICSEEKDIVSWFYRKTVWVININLGEVTIQMCYKGMRLDDILDWGRRVLSRAQMEGVT